MSGRTVIVAIARPGPTSTSSTPAPADARSPASITSALRRAISTGSVNPVAGATSTTLGLRPARQVEAQAAPRPGVQAVGALVVAQRTQPGRLLLGREAPEAEPLVVRTVPRHLEVRRQRHRAEALTRCPPRDVVEERPTDALPGGGGIDTDLLDVRGAVDDVEHEVTEGRCDRGRRNPGVPGA